MEGKKSEKHHQPSRVSNVSITHQANRLIGLQPTTIPIVLGLVACSNVYANCCILPKDSSGDGGPFITLCSGVPSGGDWMTLKLTCTTGGKAQRIILPLE